MTNTRQRREKSEKPPKRSELSSYISPPSEESPGDKSSDFCNHPTTKRYLDEAKIVREAIYGRIGSGEQILRGYQHDDLEPDKGRQGSNQYARHYINTTTIRPDVSMLMTPPSGDSIPPLAYSEYLRSVIESHREVNNTDDDRDRIKLLMDAADRSIPLSNPISEAHDSERNQAIDILGGANSLGRHITNDAELVEAIAIGFPSDVIASLRDNDVPAAALEQVIAPRRTLMRRKAEKQRLTRNESDSAWRLAWTVGLAFKVLKNRKAAVAWMSRPKENLNGFTAFDLVESSVGAAYVGRILHQLEWGDVA